MGSGGRWIKKYTNVTSNRTITATYKKNDPEVKTYTVWFVDYDDSKLYTQVVEEGKAAIAPPNPTREGYTFIGWDTDFSNVQSDLTVKAQYVVAETTDPTITIASVLCC